MPCFPMAKKQAAAAPALPADILALIAERDEILPWLEKAKARELELRGMIAAQLFPAPTEGVNRIITEDGYEIVLDHTINRKIDEQALDSVMAELPDDSPYRQVGVLIAYKPQLVLKSYRTMPEEQLKIVQQAIMETDGSPKLIVNRPNPEALDPATAPASPDWPATSSNIPIADQPELPPALPIMAAYEAAKNGTAAASARAAASSARVSTTGRAAAAKTARGVTVKTQRAKKGKK